MSNLKGKKRKSSALMLSEQREESKPSSVGRTHRPFSVLALAALQVILAIISIPSGALLISSPNGQALQAQTMLSVLKQRLPFIQDFTPVGIFLLVVYGILPLVFAYGLLTQRKHAWTLTLLLGITEIGWIVAELVIFPSFGFFFFYPIIAGMGAVTLILCLLRSTRRWFYQRK
jgi:hypothetical protein